MSKSETITAGPDTIRAAPDHPPPEKARPRGLAGLSTALQAMAGIERIMQALPEGERPKVAAWFAAEYGWALQTKGGVSP